MGKPIIEINELSKCYRLGQFGFSSFREEVEKWMRRMRGHEIEEINSRDFWALRDVSFSVQPGEVVGIIGRNGAGKSTLLKILSRITEPTQGEIVLRGRVASLLEVGTGFHPELSGRENIFLNGAILGMTMTEIARKFDEIVDFAEVEKFIDTPVKRYSSGMYVRLAFAVAAHLEPEILIVDEVLAVGDSAFQKKCLGKMRDVAREGGRTVLFVSHNLGAVASLTKKCAYLRQGSLVDFDETAAVIRSYSGDHQSNSSEWKAPRENENPLQITAMRILTVDGDVGAEFELGHGFLIEMEYVVRERMRNTVVEAWVFSAEGTKLLVVGDYYTRPELLEERTPGRYRVKISMQGEVLNIGTYTVILNSCAHGMHTFDYHEAGVFTIVETEGATHQSQRGGLLAVRSTCGMEKIG
jgi:lipopolysaccharide transport system ATP-binding protein